jgi:rubrerythrin
MKDAESIIERAIKNEQEACDFYRDLAQSVADREVKDTLEFLAREELGHKANLERYRTDGLIAEAESAIDYRVAEHLTKPDIQKDIRSQDVYLIAANRELNSHHFYLGLADLHPAGAVKEMLLRMAADELKHKEKMEYLYANTAFPQTAGG